MITINEILVYEEKLNKFNSITKYPSILTYHALGKKGGLTTELCEGKTAPVNETLYVTEKVDGMNIRIVILGDDFLIGSRENFVFASGDRICSHPELVEPLLKNLTCYMSNYQFPINRLTVLFGECYGHKIATGKQYNVIGDNSRGFRLFDAITMPIDMLENLLDSTPDNIAVWRDHGQQPFVSRDELAKLSNMYRIPIVPDVFKMNSDDLPVDVEKTQEWLQQFKDSKVAFAVDGETQANQMYGRAEGVVIRTNDRRFIRKLRFEDYEKGKARNWYRE